MTKIDIYNKVIELTSEMPIENVSMRTISKGMDCSVSSLYYYCKGKSKLFEDTYKYAINVVTVDPSGYDSLRLYLKDMFSVVFENKDKHRFFMKYYNASFLSEETKMILKEQKQKHITNFKQIVEKEVAFESIDSKMHYYIIFGSLFEILKVDEISEKEMDHLISMICYGILGEKNE
jgi:AcrR family transcriptional regulator